LEDVCFFSMLKADVLTAWEIRMLLSIVISDVLPAWHIPILFWYQHIKQDMYMSSS
jgi:hypothetical protein